MLTDDASNGSRNIATDSESLAEVGDLSLNVGLCDYRVRWGYSAWRLSVFYS